MSAFNIANGDELVVEGHSVLGVAFDTRTGNWLSIVSS